jgi:asparagine synthase (glutamine-hydrolysing)
LKQVAERYLPESLIRRKKSGFGLPMRSWFQKELQPIAYDLLGEARLKRQGLFDSTTPSRWLREHREMTADHSAKLYSLMTFQLWLEQLGVQV